MATIVGASSGSPPPQPMQYDDETPLFTCLSCSIAFPNPEDQRTHYRSDLHRYNMKRRVANLPPVKADVFNAKILERRAQLTAEESQANATVDKCVACNKTFLSHNAYKDHLNARKHKDNEARLAKASTSAAPAAGQQSKGGDNIPLVFRVPNPAAQVPELKEAQPNTASAPTEEPEEAKAEKKKNLRQTLMVDENATEEEIQAAIDAKVAASRRLDPSKECIFCSASNFGSLIESLAHMSKVHGFFIPDSEYLVDLPGLMSYLADKVSVGNICLYCNGKGRGFHDMSSVRKHMIDKCHCKIAYELEVDQLEFSDFYDFTSSYPAVKEDEEWEDADGDEEMEDGDDEVVDLTMPRGTERHQGVRFGDSENELILPSGARIGHRSLRRYYEQNLSSRPSLYDHEDSQRFGGGSALARRLIQESGMGHHKRDGTLVKDRGGQVVKARNRGEAKEAKRHIREFRDVARKEAYKTRVAFTNNNQKHFRDPLLQ
ncbi:pre-60S factor rei1 [Thecaphora frezii]